MAFDNGYKLNSCPITFNDFLADNFIDFIVVSFYQNVWPDFANELFWSGLVKKGDVVDVF